MNELKMKIGKSRRFDLTAEFFYRGAACLSCSETAYEIMRIENHIYRTSVDEIIVFAAEIPFNCALADIIEHVGSDYAAPDNG